MPPIPLPVPHLADDRVLVREPREEDVAWIARESRDPLVPRFTTVPPDNSEDHVRAFFLAQGPLRERGEQVHLVAVERATGERIGPVGLHHVEWAHRRAEIGFWTAAGMRGRGLTTDAARLVCAWALGPLGLARVELRADVGNVASQRVAERLGFTREGVLRSAREGLDGRCDVVVHGLLPGELTSR